jgi:hypothetical protein
VFCDGFLHVLKIDAEALALHDEFLELLFEEVCSFVSVSSRPSGHVDCDEGVIVSRKLSARIA